MKDKKVTGSCQFARTKGKICLINPTTFYAQYCSLGIHSWVTGCWLDGVWCDLYSYVPVTLICVIVDLEKYLFAQDEGGSQAKYSLVKLCL